MQIKNEYLEYLIEERGIHVTQIAADFGLFSQNISNWRRDPVFMRMWFVAASSRRYNVPPETLVKSIYATFPEEWVRQYLRKTYFVGSATKDRAKERRRAARNKRARGRK